MRGACASVAVAVGAWVLVALACGDGSGRGGTAATGRLASATEGVVATVNGQAISLAEVERLAALGGLSARDSLARLEAEVLLGAEAERRGYGARQGVVDGARQAWVQALLAADVEREGVSDAELDAAYAASGERFRQPEKRAAIHVLASPPKGATPAQERAAQEFATQAIATLMAAADPGAAALAFRGTSSPDFVVKVEQLAPGSRAGPYVPEFTAALFTRAAPGVVAKPVRTEYGWHAIVVTGVLAAHDTPEAEWRPLLRAELEIDKRARALEALLRSLQRRSQIAYAVEANRRLAALEL